MSKSNLTTCKLCSETVSTNAKSCPNCGDPNPTGRSLVGSANKFIPLLSGVGVIVGLMCLLGVFPLPYPYYSFLRNAVLVGAVALIGCSLIRKKYVLIVPLIVIAFVFFEVKGLDKIVWVLIDIVAGMVFLCTASCYIDDD